MTRGSQICRPRLPGSMSVSRIGFGQRQSDITLKKRARSVDGAAFG